MVCRAFAERSISSQRLCHTKQCLAFAIRSLANSEQIPAGSTCEFEITCMDDAHEKAVMEWLDYGKLRGLGQWRNSGKGRFTYEILG